MNIKTSLLVVLSCVCAGCSASLPPNELIDARAAYSKAAGGPAAELNPAQLHVAQEQLATAERSYDSGDAIWKTRDLAYVAQRKAELAEVLAQTTKYDEQVNLAAHQVQLTQARELENAKSQLVQTRQQLVAATAAMNELAAMKTIQAVKQEDRGMVITLSGSVLFTSAKYELLSSAADTLARVSEALAKSDPTSKIVVQGYTDSQGGDAYNQSLSQHRAETVRAFLTSHGIAPERITAEGFGPARPVADNATAEGRANNRRVEIVVQPPTAPQQPPVPSTTSTTTSTTVR
jgi:outer membrane protein OmpA-like peptidoglycan-associated protein